MGWRGVGHGEGSLRETGLQEEVEGMQVASWMEMGVSGEKHSLERRDERCGRRKTPPALEPSQKPTFEVRPQEEGMDARDQNASDGSLFVSSDWIL